MVKNKMLNRIIERLTGDGNLLPRKKQRKKAFDKNRKHIN